MAETVADKQACSKCGAEVREGTAFCYSCGGRVAAEQTPEEQTNGSVKVLNAESKAALDDLAEKMKGDEPVAEQDNKLAKAAAQRKKARVVQRKDREFVWEPRDDTPVVFLISVAVVAIVAIVTVLVTVVWK